MRYRAGETWLSQAMLTCIPVLALAGCAATRNWCSRVPQAKPAPPTFTITDWEMVLRLEMRNYEFGDLKVSGATGLEIRVSKDGKNDGAKPIGALGHAVLGRCIRWSDDIRERALAMCKEIFESDGIEVDLPAHEGCPPLKLTATKTIWREDATSPASFWISLLTLTLWPMRASDERGGVDDSLQLTAEDGTVVFECRPEPLQYERSIMASYWPTPYILALFLGYRWEVPLPRIVRRVFHMPGSDGYHDYSVSHVLYSEEATKTVEAYRLRWTRGGEAPR